MSKHTFRGEIILTGKEGKHESLRLKGDVKSEADITAVSVNIKGSLSTERDVTADKEFNFKGKLSAGNIRAQAVKIYGNIHAGRIQGDNVKLLTDSDGKAESITGTNISVRCGIDPAMIHEFVNITGKILRFLHFDDSELQDVMDKAASEKRDGKPVFVCNDISGEEIELYGVTCGHVSGKNITLHENCRIERISYSENFSADESCSVGRAEKV